MSGKSAFIYHDDYLDYQFGPTHPLKPERIKSTLELLLELGVFNDETRRLEPKPATEDQLRLVHSMDFIKLVKKMSERGGGYFDLGDTPARRGIYKAACSVVGGSLLGADLIMKGEVLHAFNVGGGLHHAKEGEAAGFCVFNDVGIAARYLQKVHGVEKIAIVDIDGHHGDGTQEIFYNEPILTISLHRFGPFFYPGTGEVYEIGSGNGRGYSVNVPLPEGTFDEAYLYAFREVVLPLIKSYRPEIVLNQFGVDGHYQDPLVGLSLTTEAYRKISTIMHETTHEICEGRYLIFGGGGYNPVDTAKCWSAMFTTVTESKSSNEKIYEKLSDKVEIGGDDNLWKTVEKVVEEVKKKIFPPHNLI